MNTVSVRSGCVIAVAFATIALCQDTSFAQGYAAPPAAAPAVAAPATSTPATPAAAAAPTAQPAAQPPPSGPAVTTVYDERIAAKVTGIEDDQLVIATDLVRKVPLEEIASVDFGNAPEFAAEWVGQVNRDLVQVGGAAGANGIQDVQIRLRGLADGKNLKQ